MSRRAFVVTSFAVAVLLAGSAPARTATASVAWPREGLPVCALPGAQYDARVAASGGFYVLWTDERDGHPQLYLSDVGYGPPEPTWPEGGIRIAPSDWAQGDAAVESSLGDGSCLTAWIEDRGTGSGQDLYLQRYRWNGLRASGWPEQGVRVCGALGDQADVKLYTDGASAFLLWRDERSGNSDVYLQVLGHDGQPRAGWPADGFAVSAGPEEELPAGMLPGLCVLWTRGGRVVLQQYDVSPGPQRSYSWPEGGFVVSDTTVFASNPVMAMSLLYFTWELAWEELRDSRAQVRYLHLGTNFPLPVLTPAVPVAPSALSNQRRPQVLADYFGRVSVVWEDDRADSGDIYRQLYELGGTPTIATPQSGPEGEAVCAEAGRQRDPVVSLHIAWGDERGGPATAAIQARRLIGTTGQLSAPSLVLAPAVGAQTGPSSGHYRGFCIPEACPGYDVVAWTDTRDPATAPDIYAQAFGPDVQYYFLGVPEGHAKDFATLTPARPTPARGTVTLSLTLPRAGDVALEVYDAAGRHVQTLVRGALPPGRHEVTWDGRGRDGGAAAPGLYFVRGRADGRPLARRIVRLTP